MQKRCDVYMCVVQLQTHRPRSPIKCVCVCYVLECTPCQQKTSGVLPSWWCVPLLTPLPAGPCRAAPTVGMMILKGGGVGRGWSQFCLISQSSLESRRSRSLGVSSLSVSLPQCGGCVPVCWDVPQCKRVCPSVGRCVPVCEGVSLCVRVCPSMGVCAAVWEGVSH